MNRRLEMWIAVLLVCLSFGLQVMSIREKSPTYDEQGYIARGYAYVKLGDLHIRIGTPILLNAWNAWPLLSLPDVRLPVDHPAWAGTGFHAVSTQFLWHVNDNADQIVFLARVPTMFLMLLLCLFCYRWARELFGPWGGLLTLLLCTLDPNLIAHGRLATTDLGCTALMFIATYWLWRLLRRPSWRHLLACGVFFGLAQASKFSALLLGPIFALLFLVRALLPKGYLFPRLLYRFVGYSESQRWWGRWVSLAVTGILVLLAAVLAVWAAYGFEFGPVEGLTSWPVPAPTHIEQFLDLSGRLVGAEGREATAFLNGDLYVGGHWQYFPVAFALKTPIPTLVALAVSILLGFRKRLGSDSWVLWLPPIVFFASSLASELNLGYRYILPVLPFALVFAGRTGQWLAEGIESAQRGSRRAFQVTAASVLVGWSVWSGVTIYPHYLAFFNELAGGPDGGWRYLVDSNIDWGQDLPGLKRWMDDHGVERIKLGYVGEAYPTYYGINFDPLSSFPDRWQHPHYHDLYPLDPQPGIYAISANLIQGRNLSDPETYAWFREREPIDKIGYSIFIYEVPLRGQGEATVVLSGLIPADIRLEDYARLGTNDVRVLWSNVDRSVVYPRDGNRAFWLVADGAAVHPAISYPPAWTVREASGTRNGRTLHWLEGDVQGMNAHTAALAADAPVWHLNAARFAPGDPQNHGQRLDYPVAFGESLSLLAYEIDQNTPSAGGALTVVTYWHVRAPVEAELRLFVHLLDANSTYLAGEDRLDVWYDNWLPGDRFAQVQEVPLNAQVEGEVQVEIGWYYLETMQRLPVMAGDLFVADRVLLRPLEVR